MHPSPRNRAVEERTYHNRAVDDAHAWLVDHAQGIEDECGVPIPVDFYQLSRMREVKARYGDPRAVKRAPATQRELQMMANYDILMSTYANRPGEEEEAPFNVGGMYLVVCFLVAALAIAIGYGLWRWLN